MVIAVIPARGGSKRVPRKNLRPLAGFPLIDWTIAAALGSRFNRIIVTSDAPEILGRAKIRGIKTLKRPAYLAADNVPDLSVVRHAIYTLALRPEDLIVYLRPTAPFRRPEEINAVVALLRDHPEASSVRSVIPAPCHPRKCFVDAGWDRLGYRALLPYTPNHAANGPSQGLEPVFMPVGFIDVVRAEWISRGSMEGSLIAAWEAPADRCCDLDTEADFARAEALALARGWRPGEIGA